MKFEVVKKNASIGLDIKLPKRSTGKSAGYDFYTPYDVSIRPNEGKTVPTMVKCKMDSDEVLLLFVRSSIGIKKQLMLMNGTGVIDSDYYGNESNDGNIMIPLYNYGNKTVEIKAGERIAQGVVVKYVTSEDDDAKLERKGGMGSTGC